MVMNKVLDSIEINHPNIKNVYRGKVRDVYTFDNGKLAMIVSDRISAFDHILPKRIPHKGAVLNGIAKHFLENTSDIVPNWLQDTPDPNISIGLACEPIKLELVVRGYLVGHAWREYKDGKRKLCGVSLPEGLKKNQKFDAPIITPATKAEEGHDEDISKAEILEQGIVSESIWNKLESYSLALFERGTQMAADRGLILVDTKYEFGMYDDQVYLIDEIHTPDSSRYFYLDSYKEKFDNGEDPIQLSKEFVREWLMENGFQGKEGQVMPVMDEEMVDITSKKYTDLYKLITGNEFLLNSDQAISERVETALLDYLNSTK